MAIQQMQRGKKGVVLAMVLIVEDIVDDDVDKMPARYIRRPRQYNK